MYVFVFVVYSDVVSNVGQFPLAKGDAYSFKSTGPLCRYAADLLPMFKLIVLPEHRTKLRLDEQVLTLSVLSADVWCRVWCRDLLCLDLEMLKRELIIIMVVIIIRAVMAVATVTTVALVYHWRQPTTFVCYLTKARAVKRVSWVLEQKLRCSYKRTCCQAVNMSASPTEKLHCVIFNFIRSFVHEQKLNKEIVNICLYNFGEVHENEMYSVSQKTWLLQLMI